MSDNPYECTPPCLVCEALASDKKSMRKILEKLKDKGSTTNIEVLESCLAPFNTLRFPHDDSIGNMLGKAEAMLSQLSKPNGKDDSNWYSNKDKHLSEREELAKWIKEMVKYILNYNVESKGHDFYKPYVDSYKKIQLDNIMRYNKRLEWSAATRRELALTSVFFLLE